MKNLVSVILPVFNCEKYLADAVSSILKSSYDNLELIIINDGSTDSTENIINSFTDKRICYFKNDSNIGLVNSLNKGIGVSTGEYIARQDADDVSAVDRLETQVSFLDKNKDIGMVGTLYDKINENGEVIVTKNLPLSDIDIKKSLTKNNCFCHGSVIFRRSIIEKTGPYRDTAGPTEDYDLWLRFSEITRVSNIEKPLYRWRVTPESIMSQSDSMQAEDNREFLRSLAAYRKTHGTDPLESRVPEYLSQFEQLKARLSSKPAASRSFKLSRMNFSFAEDLLKNNCLERSMYYLKLSILAYPFNFEAWKLFFAVLKKRLLS
ncbi:MAG: glycosyltransferase [Planctomycetota bacterium]|jgi:glycosyltransferase involved in cell wall biosynthesis